MAQVYPKHWQDPPAFITKCAKTTYLNWGYIGIMEKKMEATIL